MAGVFLSVNLFCFDMFHLMSLIMSFLRPDIGRPGVEIARNILDPQMISMDPLRIKPVFPDEVRD